MEDIKKNIMLNIAALRKAKYWTQAELADKLNYSDKSVSKWERGEGMPDIVVLKQLSELFGVSIDYIVSEHKKRPVPRTNRKKLIISLLSGGLVWLAAVVVYVLWGIIAPDSNFPVWLFFIYAIPGCLTVLLVFSLKWSTQPVSFIIISLLMWTIALSLFLSLKITNRFLFFVLPVPLQILAVLWFLLKKR